jgi:tetratricopeptide (TPR) repeat protein
VFKSNLEGCARSYVGCPRPSFCPLAWLGEIALREADPLTAEQFLDEALRADEPRHAGNDASYYEALGEVARHGGDEERAEKLFRDALRVALTLRNYAVATDCLEDLALLAKDRRETRRAARCWATGQAVRAVVAAAPSRHRVNWGSTGGTDPPVRDSRRGGLVRAR